MSVQYTHLEDLGFLFPWSGMGQGFDNSVAAAALTGLDFSMS